MQANPVHAPQKAKVSRILIIDDDVDIVAILKQAFLDDDWKVFTATNGVQALHIMGSEKFDAIISDLKMPGMNGIEFITHTKVNRLNKSAKIFILSGAIDGDSLKRIAAIGVANILAKPLNIDALVKKVRSKCFDPGSMQTAAAAKPTISYDVDIVKCIIRAMQEVIQFYLSDKGKVGKPYIKTSSESKGYFTALIALNQGDSMGSIAFSSDEKFLQRLSKGIFGDDCPEPSDELTRDLAGEMCNQISGKIKINLAKYDYYVNIGLPKVIVGQGHSISHPVNSPVIVIPMQNQDCNFVIEFTISGQMKKTKKEPESGPSGNLDEGGIFF